MDNRRKGLEVLLPQYNIEGFDPNDVLMLLTDETPLGEKIQRLYMGFAESARWFYTVFPRGGMDYDIIYRNDDKIIVKGKIYRDIHDPLPAATALCSRYRTNDEHGKFFEQNAVTAAYRKALEYLGFGTPLNAHITENTIPMNGEEVPERGEAGVFIPASLVPKELLPVENNNPKRVPTKFEGEMPSLPEALAFVIPNGYHKGKTIEQYAKEKGDNSVKALLNNSKLCPEGSDYHKAVTAFCNCKMI